MISIGIAVSTMIGPTAYAAAAADRHRWSGVGHSDDRVLRGPDRVGFEPGRGDVGGSG
jgi:hypothetical protein